MKTALLILTALAVLAGTVQAGDDCDSLIQSEYDKMTDFISFSTKNNISFWRDVMGHEPYDTLRYDLWITMPEAKARLERVYATDSYLLSVGILAVKGVVDYGTGSLSDTATTAAIAIHFSMEPDYFHYDSEQDTLLWDSTASTPCINKGARVIFLLESGRRWICETEQDSNCDGRFYLIFQNYSYLPIAYSPAAELDSFLSHLPTEDLDSLSASPISTMRIYTNKESIDFEWPEDKAQRFMDALNCIRREVGF
jgi:hypothetical protein